MNQGGQPSSSVSPDKEGEDGVLDTHTVSPGNNETAPPVRRALIPPSTAGSSGAVSGAPKKGVRAGGGRGAVSLISPPNAGSHNTSAPSSGATSPKRASSPAAKERTARTASAVKEDGGSQGVSVRSASPDDGDVKYKGVNFDRESGLWRSIVYIPKDEREEGESSSKFVGRFSSCVTAAREHDRYIIQRFGMSKMAENLNFPELAEELARQGGKAAPAGPCKSFIQMQGKLPKYLDSPKAKPKTSPGAVSSSYGKSVGGSSGGTASLSHKRMRVLSKKFGDEDEDEWAISRPKKIVKKMAPMVNKPIKAENVGELDVLICKLRAAQIRRNVVRAKVDAAVADLEIEELSLQILEMGGDLSP